MPQWFIRGLRRGVVTTRYPARAEPSARDLPRPPEFRAGALSRQAADELAQVCPSRALTRSEDVLVFDVGACTASGRCRKHSPDAVTAGAEFELATTARQALVKQIPLLTDGEVSA
jgi:hypothetical protein